MPGRPILVFDSGIGGLSVLRVIQTELPGAALVYVADDAAFPYGDWEEAALSEHIVALMGELLDRYDPAAVVIACNTASTLVLPPLRAKFAVPFVGTVPAIKPAAEQTKTAVIAVLSTPGTMKRVYTRELIQNFAQSCHVRLVGAPELAALAEAKMRGEVVEAEAICRQIEPCFVDVEGARTDIVVLACTHYPFLVEELDRLSPWPVVWLDPARAIVRRLVSVLDGQQVATGPNRALFTGGSVSPHLRAVLQSFGLMAGFDREPARA